MRSKVATRLNALTRQLIERSPFVCLATADARGNRLADSLRNIVANPHVGLLFVIPGVGDSFRVDGRATITDDPALLSGSIVEGKALKLGVLVDIEHAYTQCSKAFLRSHLWDPSRFIDRATLPTNGQIHALLSGGEVDAATYDEERAARYARREGFY